MKITKKETKTIIGDEGEEIEGDSYEDNDEENVDEFCMQKVASVTFILFLRIYNFIIYHPNSK